MGGGGRLAMIGRTLLHGGLIRPTLGHQESFGYGVQLGQGGGSKSYNRSFRVAQEAYLRWQSLPAFRCVKLV